MKLNTNNTRLTMSAGTVKQFPCDRVPQIAFSGRSNVGKSSLINTMLGNKSLARVSSSPGKTITINFFNIDKKLYFVDLPGYGYAKRSYDGKEVWSALTDSYFSKNPNADSIRLVCQLIDVRCGPTDDDIMMINYLIDSGIPFKVVATKTDKLSKTALKARIDELKHEYFEGTDIDILPFSSVTRDGKEQMWSEIFKHAKI